MPWCNVAHTKFAVRPHFGPRTAGAELGDCIRAQFGTAPLGFPSPFHHDVVVARALRQAIEIGAALHQIHSRGVVHGALSPYCIAPATDRAWILYRHRKTA